MTASSAAAGSAQAVGVRVASEAARAAPQIALAPWFWPAALAGAALAAAATGLPTVMYPSPLFARMTPVRPLDYLFWVTTALALGPLLATYLPGAVRNAACRGGGDSGGGIGAGGLLAVFAIGCPVCNKLVVLAVGASGALAYFAPAQPVLGAVSLAVLAYTLVVRLRALGALGRPR